MRGFRLLLLALLSVTAFASCDLTYQGKPTLGDPGAFNGTGSSVDLLPALDANCGSSNCIR